MSKKGESAKQNNIPEDKKSGIVTTSEQSKQNSDLADIIGSKAKRIEKSEREQLNVLRGLTAALSVGWTLLIPLMICVAIGVWVDTKIDGGSPLIIIISIVIGFLLGGYNVWHSLRSVRMAKRDEDVKVDKDKIDKIF